MQLKTGTLVNDDTGLEKEADIMGNKAKMEGSQSSTVQFKKSSHSGNMVGKVIQKFDQQDAMRLSEQNSHTKKEVLADEITPATYGEKSENVKKIQQVLIKMNYWTGEYKATGYFGDTTKESLINFQIGYMKLKKKDLYGKNGKYIGCGSKTAKKLSGLYKMVCNSNVYYQAQNAIMEQGKSPDKNPTYSWQIKAGQFNGYVKEAQINLMNLGYKLPKYGADGKWSNTGETYNAILGFQKSCNNTYLGIRKNGGSESLKQIAHFEGVYPSGKLDEKTYKALKQEASKKVKVVKGGNKPKEDKDDQPTFTDALDDMKFSLYFLGNRGSSPATAANTNVTPEVAIEVLKNLSKGELPWRPELSQNGGSAFFITEGNPYTGIDKTKNFRIDVNLEIPKNALVFNEADLLKIYNRHKNACKIEAEQKFRKYNKIPEEKTFSKSQMKDFEYFHNRFAERLMWNEVGETVRKSPAKVGEVILKNSIFSKKQGDGKFAVVADASKIKVKGGIEGLTKLLKERGVSAEPAVVEAAEAIAKKQKWAGKVRSVFRYGGKVLIVVGVATDVYKVYVAKDKVKAVVESAVGWAGATAGASAFAAWWTPADVAGPWAWVAHGVGTLLAGGVGYWVGSEVTRTIYELVVED